MANARIAVANVVALGLLTVAAWSFWHGRPALDPVISVGERREGRLLSSDMRKGSKEGPEARWVLNGRRDQMVRLSGDSYEFDVSLRLLDPMNHEIAWADDNGGFYNASIVMSLPVTGRYTVIVSGANGDQIGTYWLTLQEGEREQDWSRTAAESYYERGIEWARQTGSKRAVCWLNLGMGSFFRQRREWDRAEKYYAESIRGCGEESEMAYGRWAIAVERGRLFTRRRWFDQAVGEFQRALELSKKLRSAREAEMLVQIGFGNLYNSMGRVDLAKVYLRNAAREAELGGRPATLVQLYTSLNAVPEGNDKDKAIEYAENGYRLCAGLNPEAELQAIHSLAGACLFLAKGRSQEGLALADRMRIRAQQTGCIDDEVTALTLMSMGYYASSNIEAMIRHAGEAFALTNPADEDPGPRRIALQLLADGEMESGHHQKALDWCLKALQTVENAWARESIEELRQELLSESKAICTQIIMNLHALNSRYPNSEYARQAFDYAERSRSRSLLAQLLPGEESKGGVVDPSMLRRDQDLTDKLSAVRGQLALLRASSEASRDKLYRLQEERAHLLGQHLQLQAEVRNSVGNSLRAAHLAPLTAEEVRTRLLDRSPNTAVLCYQLGIQKSFLIVLTRDWCRLFELRDFKSISKAVLDWRLQVSAQQTAGQGGDSRPMDQVGHRLYNLLVEPAAKMIEGQDLIVVPSDVLSAVAFEALVVVNPAEAGHSRRPRYLVEQHAITYAPSLSVLVEIETRWRQSEPGRSMLLIGDPSVNGTDTRIAGSGDQTFVARFEGIPAAREEILDIARIGKRNGIAVTKWIGSDASEARLKKSDLSAFRFLHIATHGIADPQDGGASALTLFPSPDEGQDGILTCDEIARLRLSADLVVLSGCQTGTGQSAGAEGVVGLNRTFLLAGARCVCGSLWPVEDIWTQRFMSRFYSRLIGERLPKSQALRFAKLDLIRDGANPSQWAPFVLAGSSR